MERLTNSGTKEAKSDVTIREIIEKLAECEDLEEQGKLLKLPVAVGTWVYEVYRFMDGGVCEIDVHKIKLEDLDNIGKTVFLTRPEAEDKLVEMEGKNGN